jgi:frataxin-like iron-binding protein CyaY
LKVSEYIFVNCELDEILRQIEGAKFFTEVDLSQGYLQLTLSEESQYITAFSTPLIMGASPS